MQTAYSRQTTVGFLALTAFLSAGARADNGGEVAPLPTELSAAAQRMVQYERDYSKVMENLEYLSDMIGPRLTGSEKLKTANEWTAEKMKEYGLENVHLEAYTIPRGWERGKVEARVLEPTNLPISAAQMAWSPGTHGKVTGQVVIFAPESEADFAAMPSPWGRPSAPLGPLTLGLSPEDGGEGTRVETR